MPSTHEFLSDVEKRYVQSEINFMHFVLETKSRKRHRSQEKTININKILR
jgi:hypothetical protein